MSTHEPVPGLAVAKDAAEPAPRGLADHLPALLRQAQIGTVELDLVHRRPSFHGSEVSTDARSITSPARDEHRRRGFGFWEFVLAEAVGSDPETRRGLLTGALRHNSDGAIRVRLERETFIDRLRDGQYENLPPRDLVSFCSSVSVTGDERQLHLPLLDLGVKPTADGQVAAVDAMASLGLNGLLFLSGRSYHFYGAKPVTQPQLVALLARAQLLSPIVDSRWASHQLIDGRCGLRISTDSEKTPFQPEFVAQVGSG
ncbi:hypothetical protein LL946_10575 [Knoellia locipacati]|uniref:primase 1D-like protein n=1 Tax=Knoellia locipacati TaxID=882824 RepID=UPI00384EF971